MEALYPGDHRHPAAGADVRPHAGQLIHVAVAVLKDVLLKDGGASGPQQRRHQDGLGIRGKARVRRRPDGWDGPERPLRPEAQAVRPALHGAARLGEGVRHRGQLLRPDVPERHIAPGGGGGAEVGGRRDPVRHHGVLRPVEGRADLHHHGGGPGPGDSRPAGAEKDLQVNDLRLPGGIQDAGGALCGAGRQHQVLRCPHGGQSQHDVRAPELPAPAEEGASLLPDLRPQLPQSPQVQVDGPGPQLAAAGIAELRRAAAAQDGSQKDGGGAHLPHEGIRHGAAADAGGIHPEAVPLPLRRGSYVAQDLQRDLHIPEPGAAVQYAHAPAQNGGRQNGQDAVLRALRRQLAREAFPSPQHESAHSFPSLPIISHGLRV